MRKKREKSIKKKENNLLYLDYELQIEIFFEEMEFWKSVERYNVHLIINNKIHLIITRVFI